MQRHPPSRPVNSRTPAPSSKSPGSWVLLSFPISLRLVYSSKRRAMERRGAARACRMARIHGRPGHHRPRRQRIHGRPGVRDLRSEDEGVRRSRVDGGALLQTRSGGVRRASLASPALSPWSRLASSRSDRAQDAELRPVP
ncbi:unnamed protein product [Urochloa humidicola]